MKNLAMPNSYANPNSQSTRDAVCRSLFLSSSAVLTSLCISMVVYLVENFPSLPTAYMGLASGSALVYIVTCLLNFTRFSCKGNNRSAHYRPRQLFCDYLYFILLFVGLLGSIYMTIFMLLHMHSMDWHLTLLGGATVLLYGSISFCNGMAFSNPDEVYRMYTMRKVTWLTYFTTIVVLFGCVHALHFLMKNHENLDVSFIIAVIGSVASFIMTFTGQITSYSVHLGHMVGVSFSPESKTAFCSYLWMYLFFELVSIFSSFFFINWLIENKSSADADELCWAAFSIFLYAISFVVNYASLKALRKSSTSAEVPTSSATNSTIDASYNHLLHQSPPFQCNGIFRNWTSAQNQFEITPAQEDHSKDLDSGAEDLYKTPFSMDTTTRRNHPSSSTPHKAYSKLNMSKNIAEFFAFNHLMNNQHYARVKQEKIATNP